MPSLLPGAPQPDPGSYLYPGARETYIVPGYVYFSDDYLLLLLGI